MTTKPLTPAGSTEIAADRSALLTFLNRYKLLIQWGIVLIGLALFGLMLAGNISQYGLDLASRQWEHALKELAGPVQIGVFTLMALWVVRLLVKRASSGGVRTLFRLLQIIHTPIAILVGVVAMTHGLGIMLFHREPGPTNLTGMVTLVFMVGTIALGTWISFRRKQLPIHRWMALAAFALFLVHKAVG